MLIKILLSINYFIAYILFIIYLSLGRFSQNKVDIYLLITLGLVIIPIIIYYCWKLIQWIGIKYFQKNFEIF